MALNERYLQSDTSYCKHVNGYKYQKIKRTLYNQNLFEYQIRNEWSMLKCDFELLDFAR